MLKLSPILIQKLKAFLSAILKIIRIFSKNSTFSILHNYFLKNTHINISILLSILLKILIFLFKKKKNCFSLHTQQTFNLFIHPRKCKESIKINKIYNINIANCVNLYGYLSQNGFGQEMHIFFQNKTHTHIQHKVALLTQLKSYGHF